MSARRTVAILGGISLLICTTRNLSEAAEPGHATQAGAGVSQGLWHIYDRPDGFASPIRALHQDDVGQIWMATISGLCRYDGRTLTCYSQADGLPSTETYGMYAEQNGDLWLALGYTGSASGSGVSRFDGETFENFSVADGLVHDRVVAITKDHQGRMWFGTNAGVSILDAGKFTSFTESDGLVPGKVRAMSPDRLGNMWIGTWGGGLSRYDGHSFTNFGVDQGLAGTEVRCVYLDRSGRLWVGTVDGLSLYRDGSFTTFTTADGLDDNHVLSLLEDRHGVLWIGTANTGYSTYDGQTFTAHRNEGGFSPSWTTSLLEDHEGNMWFGTWNGGLARYFGTQFTSPAMNSEGESLVAAQAATVDTAGNIWVATWGSGVSIWDGVSFSYLNESDGLAEDFVASVLQDRDGRLWFGTLGAGVSRYDGDSFATYTMADGLGSDDINDIVQTQDGTLWIATGDPLEAGGGLSRFDGARFSTLTDADGLVHNNVTALAEGGDGRLWIGTGRGVSVLEDGVLRSVDLPEVADAYINHILIDSRGRRWFSTRSGVHRYGDGPSRHLHTTDGLGSETVWSAMEDRSGHIWFATNAGLNRYDGRAMQRLLRRDGLAGNTVYDVVQHKDGSIWICTHKGLTRFTEPAASPPTLRLVSITADRKYAQQDEVNLTSSDDYVGIELQGLSFKTRPDQLVYVYRLHGYDENWRQADRERVEYHDLPVGEYTFEAMVADRDLTYSTPLTLRVVIRPPYREFALLALLGFTALGLVLATRAAVSRRRERDRAREDLLHELEDELQVATDLQMGLMPAASPDLEGLSIAGRCLPAQQVSGDLFRYFLDEENLTLALADVTGKAMEAAIPVVMFNGILDSHVELGGDVDELYSRLNRVLCRTLDKRTFVCMSLARLQLTSRRLTIANGGCPYPYLFRAASKELSELEVIAYPLGVRPHSTYPTTEVTLQRGDYLVLLSDGIGESETASGDVFGDERLAHVLRQGCIDDLSAPDLLDAVLTEVRRFCGSHPQKDDQTLVILKIE